MSTARPRFISNSFSESTIIERVEDVPVPVVGVDIPIPVLLLVGVDEVTVRLRRGCWGVKPEDD